ncbi:Mu transposase C-terminal domain-containing protein [Segnochrobactrum spirostomi]|uniref:DDE-type integrase/transposase/recombinase n=1 Tax=Segnochrobactrum spirostomi TaxID=2608987 RepID=A0A6A7Y1W0_9HYPH|nr:Mu transposase C-terminal domain-containing protein [Segnochrobactrum spirostomi]MQT13060.1 DDE-type integrase/transposase/recombinase [Segnochrobactrum spirostomi]
MKRINFSVGEQVSIGGRVGRFVRILDFNRFLVRFESGDVRLVAPGDVDRDGNTLDVKRHFDDCTPAEIELAYRWRDALRPLLDQSTERGGRDAVVASAAEMLGVSRATVYRRLDQWNGDPVSLLPGRRSGGRGRSRLGDERDALLSFLIDKEYLNRKQRNVKEFYDDFLLPAFADAKLPSPSLPTVYRHIEALDPVLVIERRIGKRAARDAKSKMMGKFPFGTAPLSCVQIDYWPYDVEIVDDNYRIPIGRPWLAMAIDTHTCMPTGYVLTLDDPSASVAGAAVFHSITRKEPWLRAIGVDMTWPVWGLPLIVMADNAKEFRGTMLRRFLSQEDRELLNRPVKRPQFGAHIERFFGTLARKVKSAPGATGSNVVERKTRDSAKTASLTLQELELHLLSVLKEYMNTVHASLGGLTPLQKWRSCFFEDGVQVRELPEEPANLEQIRVELLPFKMLTLQTYGIRWDKISYDSDELVAMRHRYSRHKGKTFTVRRDSRDVSRAYVWDPDNKRYLTVPYRHPEGPPMSVWELRALRAEFKEKGRRAFTELEIFDACKERRQRQALLEEAGKLTRKAQRENQRRRSQGAAIAREQIIIAATAARAEQVIPIARSGPSPHDPSSTTYVITPTAAPDEAGDDYDDLDI